MTRGESVRSPYCVSDPHTGDVGGGLWARSHWGYLYTDMLFLPEALRRGGWARS